jgi:hypothetical protein
VVDDNSDGNEEKLLKRCLGDADGVMSNNNKVGFTVDDKNDDQALFNWDYGIESEGTTAFHMDNVLHPHLIKLVPTSAGQTRLCNTTGFVLTGVDNINVAGYCRASDPAGFYGVLYYRNGEFVIMSRAYQGYSATAQFNVFTTTGYLSLASKKTDVFTSIGDITVTGTTAASDVAKWTVAVFDLKSFYSNVVYTLKHAAGGINNVDCETQKSNTGANNVYQCIEKGDYVMIFDLDATSSNNPKYPNMYQVMKISRENREAVQDMQLGFESSTGPDTTDTYQSSSSATNTDYAHFERLRYQIVLDYGMNARYNKIDLTETGATNNARIYKFTPPSTHVKWVGQCSNRGICDSGSGICRCFPGYSGDDCSTMNALAQ